MGAARKEGRVLNIMPMGDTFYLSIGSEMEQAKAIILATGVVWANKYPGEAEYLGRGVSYCATCDGMLYRGKEVAVVGKAADSPQEANYLQELGCKVTYISDKAPERLRPDIPFVKAAKVEITGSGKVEALRAGSTTIPCEGVFILRPSVAPADLLPGLALEGGYIQVSPPPGIQSCRRRPGGRPASCGICGPFVSNSTDFHTEKGCYLCLSFI